MAIYKKNIPLASDRLRISRVDINNNFQAIDDVFGQDHVKFSAAADNGKHKFCRFVDQIAADPTTGATELAIYVKQVAGVQRLVYREPSNGTVRQVSGNVVASTNGETPVIGGLSMKWGTITNVPVGAGGKVFLYANLSLTAYGTNTYSLSVMPITAPAGVRVTGISKTGFTVAHNNPLAIDVQFIAIGK